MLNVHTLDSADAIRELENLWLAERRGGVPTLALFPHKWRVEAFFDGGPDRERWGKNLVAVFVANNQVSAIFHADLVDLAEEVVGRVTGEDVRKTRLNTDANEGEQTGALPLVVERILLVAELESSLAGWVGFVWLAQAHGHVEVVHACGECTRKNGRHKLWLNRVEHVGDVIFARDIGNVVCRASVDLRHQELGRYLVTVLGSNPLNGSLCS